MRTVTIDWEEKENVEWQDYAPKRKQQERRKLLITTDNFLPRWDGISRFLSEIIPRLKEEYDITVVAPDYGHVHMDGVRIEKIPLMGKSYGDYTPARFERKRIAKLVRQHDIVFNQALGPIGVCAIIAAKRARRPIANYIHSVEWELFPRALASPILRAPLIGAAKLLVRALYNRCSVLILPSENIAEQFSWQGIKTRKRVAHLGVDTRKFHPGDRKHARHQLGLPQDAFVIGYHGRIAHEKNLLALLRAYARFPSQHKRLVIVGDGIPGIKSRLERVRGVTVTGSTDSVVPWLQAMDVYVQPSLTETTSLSVLEAMACGLPVVSSKVGFIQYYIIDGRNGLFFDNRHTHELVRHFQELAKDEQLRARLGSNARKTIEKSFQWDQTAKAIKDALDEI